MGGEQSLANPRRRASVNYLIHNDGVIIGQVPEEFRPWTTGSSSADNPSITFEVQNETGAPEWKVSTAARISIARLLADIATRRNFGSLNRINYRGHREFAATACPGPYLYPRLQAICDAANAIKNGVDPAPKPRPTPSPQQEDDDMRIFRRKSDGAVVLAAPGHVTVLNMAQWQTWTNLGVATQEMDDYPLEVVLASLRPTAPQV